MIVGIGCDLIKISRVAALIDKVGGKFLSRIYTESEISAGQRLTEKKMYDYFAKRFAAKEAISKALGIGIGEDLSFLDIEIKNDAKGRPLAYLSPLKFAEFNIHLTLADEAGIALAYAIAEEK